MVFGELQSLLNGWRFILASNKGPIPGMSLNRTFSSGASVRSLFKSERVLLIDEVTYKDTLSGEAKIPLDYSIGLDTQSLSYISPYIEGRFSKLPEDFQEVFEFIAQDNVNVDPIPYVMENLKNITDPKNHDVIFHKIKGYEVLRTIDVKHLTHDKKVRSNVSDQELNLRAQSFLAKILYDMEHQAHEETIRRHEEIYCLLLKMISLQLNPKKLSLTEKIDRFLNFLHYDFSCLMLREAVIAFNYFEFGQNLLFFGKIQIRSAGSSAATEKFFKVIDGMAWDLWHTRMMEEMLGVLPNTDARYFIPSILTFDKKFIEIIDLLPLRSCGISPEGKIFPIHDFDVHQYMNNKVKNPDVVIEKYFSDRATQDRALRRGTKRKNFKHLISELEADITLTAKL
jgi:hypothetical protein